MSNFNFKLIPRITFAKQHGFDVPDVDFDYDPNLKEKDVFERLTEIQDRKQTLAPIELNGSSWIALKYQKNVDSKVPINGNSMTFAKFYRCPLRSLTHSFPSWATTNFTANHSQEDLRIIIWFPSIKAIQVGQGILPDPKVWNEDVNDRL